MQAMLEVPPPMGSGADETAPALTSRIKSEAQSCGGLDFLNILEVIEENHAGRPLYRRMDVSEFAMMLKGSAVAELVVNKIVVHLGSEDKFREWLMENYSNGIHDFVFVGGSRSEAVYPGPSVVRANEIASELKGINIGNICIPSRQGECERLVSRTKSGTSFFTTQFLFDSSKVKDLLSRYSNACEEQGVKRSSFFMSFAPAVTKFDLDFFKWLDADIPKSTEAVLRGSRDMELASIGIASKAFFDIRDFAEEEDLGISISLNVASRSVSKLGPALRMLKELRLKNNK